MLLLFYIFFAAFLLSVTNFIAQYKITKLNPYFLKLLIFAAFNLILFDLSKSAVISLCLSFPLLVMFCACIDSVKQIYLDGEDYVRLSEQDKKIYWLWGFIYTCFISLIFFFGFFFAALYTGNYAVLIYGLPCLSLGLMCCFVRRLPFKAVQYHWRFLDFWFYFVYFQLALFASEAALFLKPN